MINQAIIYLYYVEHSIIFVSMLFYVGIYPIFGSILWISNSIFYAFRRDKSYKKTISDRYYPKASVVLAARNEAKHIRVALDSACNLDYPNYEIVVINDGSTDTTMNILEEYCSAGKIRIITKKNQGKAMGINDAMMCLNGEIILMMDADSELQPDTLMHIVAPFKNPRVGAVAGNVRVKNAQNFVSRMQIVEYSAVISTIRRAQRTWGRIMTVSGSIFAIRKSAFFDVGGYSAGAPTEDIDLTWKLQRRYWDVFYESKAIAWVVQAESLRGLINQRLRWSRGLMYVSRKNFDILWHWKDRRMWPVLIETLLSTLWCICLVFLGGIWILSLLLGFPNTGLSLVPAAWGIVISTNTILLCASGFIMDRKYDPDLPKYFLYMIYYPIYYWLLLAVISVIALPVLFKKPESVLSWNSPRE